MTRVQVTTEFFSGPEKGVITKGVCSLEESLESLKSLNSLESLESGRILHGFPQSGGSPKSLESLNSRESLENGLFRKDPFAKRPLFPNPIFGRMVPPVSKHFVINAEALM